MSNAVLQDMIPDKFQRQLDLEREMQGMGVARFREEVRKAKESEMESTTHGVLNIMNHAFNPFMNSIQEWKDKCEKGSVLGGRPVHAYPMIKDVKADVLAFLAMKTIMDTISKARCLQDVTLAIATQIQSELNFKEFKKESKLHYQKVKQDVTKRTRKLKHISRVLNRSAKKDDIQLTKFAPVDKHKIGSLLLSLFIESTGLVEVYTPPQMPGQRKRKAAQVQPTEKTTEWLRNNNARCELLSPVILPMITEPKDWVNPHEGGFWSEHINISMIRRSPSSFLDETENTDMWEVYDAVNHLQKTKWAVNKKVLEVVRRCADNNLPLGNLPAGAELPLPPIPVDMETNKEARWLWRKAASNVHGENIRARSKYISLNKKIQVAERFAEEEEIFFVYSLDFRGRVYPVQVHLNPQGDDVSKSLLHFAEGKEIDGESGAWLALHGANLFGFDKVTLEDRVAWTEENTKKIIECAEDPYENRWWTEADKPWQFLAFCFEWEQFWKEPETFKSHIPVALDGSCNGLQNFSAMLRDPIGGKATNLTPTTEPQDIYQQVADLVDKKLDEDIKAGNEYAECWKGFVSRKLVKRPTMTMPYGATLTGYQDQIRDEVQSWIDSGMDYPNFGDDAYQARFYMAKLIQSSLGEVVVAAEVAMAWLQKVAKVISQENLPIYWTTPVGFPVLQNYRNILTKQVNTEIAGKFYNLKVAHDSGDKMNTRKMKSAISPNFVHSCDAAHLMRTVGLCIENEIRDLSMVHDSFGTHAADTPRLREILRHAFIQIHKAEPLQAFYEEIKKQSSTPDDIPPPPPKGSLDIEEVLKSDFFFA